MSNVVGVEPGVNLTEGLVFEGVRSLWRVTISPLSEISYKLVCGQCGGVSRCTSPTTVPSAQLARQRRDLGAFVAEQ